MRRDGPGGGAARGSRPSGPHPAGGGWALGLGAAGLLPLAGVGAALGQAPWDLWWIALPAWVVALAALGRARHPLLAGWLFGTAQFGWALSWLVEPFRVDPEATGWLAWPALGAAALGFGLLTGIAVRAGRWIVPSGAAAPLAVGACIGLMELARSYMLTGFPWALPGHALIGSPALPAAALGGAHGLGLAVLLGAGMVATRRAWAVGAGAALWGLPFAFAAAMPPAPAAGPGAPVVRLIQPNAPQHLKWEAAWIDVFFRRSLDLTAGPGAPALVVWPETTLPALLGRSEAARADIARATPAPVVLGAQRYGEDGAPRNSLALLVGGQAAAVIDKHHLVPFGEYLPFPRAFATLGVGPLAATLAGTYRPGPGPVALELPGIGRALPMICYEAIFPQYLRRIERPRLLLHLTNDAWFGTRIGPQQHLALARLRAAESGLPLLRAANTGVSAAIDARGRVLAALPLGKSGHLDAPLPAALPPTPYAATGDWPALALLTLALGAAGLAGRGVLAPPGGRA
jgi:apolipoprotein N-acyltransferase